MMITDNVDLSLYYRRKHSPPPSVLLITLPNDTSNKDRHHTINPSTEHRSQQSKSRDPPHMIGLHVNNIEIHDTSNSSFGWQRHSDKISQLTLAPDVAYRNRYLKETKRELSDLNNGNYRPHSRSPSPRNQHSPLLKSTNSPESSSSQKSHSHPYRTVYDYIRDSIRQIERQRNLKQQNISSRIKRPQNSDSTLRRVLAEKRPSTRASGSRSSVTTTQTVSTLFNTDLKSPESFVNYINYSRVVHSTPPNHSYQQEANDEYNRQRPITFQN